MLIPFEDEIVLSDCHFCPDINDSKLYNCARLVRHQGRLYAFAVLKDKHHPTGTTLELIGVLPFALAHHLMRHIDAGCEFECLIVESDPDSKRTTLRITTDKAETTLGQLAINTLEFPETHVRNSGLEVSELDREIELKQPLRLTHEM